MGWLPRSVDDQVADGTRDIPERDGQTLRQDRVVITRRVPIRTTPSVYGTSVHVSSPG